MYNGRVTAPPHPNADAPLALLLRLVGGVELLAAAFVVVPLGWMGEVHDRVLGLGPLPPGAIVEYMARSLSALYAAHGAMVAFLSLDVPRYRPLIGLLGWLHVALGCALFGTDVSAGLPWYWVAGEGPVIAACGALIVVLARRGNAAQAG